MDFLREFSTKAEYEEYIAKVDKIMPNVSFVKGPKDVKYNVAETISVRNLICEDIPSTGGTADKTSCTYKVLANKLNGKSVDVTKLVEVSSNSLTVSATTTTDRREVGELVLTFKFGENLTSASTVVYQGGIFDNYLSFSANTLQGVKLSKTGVTVEYSYDKESWANWKDVTTEIPFGDTDNTKILYLRGENSTWSTNSSIKTFQFTNSTPVAVGGNIMALLSYENKVTTVPASGFTSLFSGATAIQSLSSDLLPATNIGNYSYIDMFRGCTGLSSVPSNLLLATTLGTYAYKSMFAHCTNLTSAPSLPAITLGYGCYQNMFWYCNSLTTAPELPSTTISQWCYSGMFKGCASLTTAPELPTTILKIGCYSEMFAECSSLNEIHCSATSISASNCTINWTSGVASAGTFYGNINTPWEINSANGIPSGWTHINKTSIQMTASAAQTVTAPTGKTFQYSYNAAEWSSMTAAVEFGTEGKETVYIRGKNASGINAAFTFGNTTAMVDLRGNCQALLNWENIPNAVPANGFRNLFSGAAALQSVSSNFLPATILASSCYRDMYSACSSLVTAPELPATTLADWCYAGMFAGGCVSLVTAPELPATTLADSCYGWMFHGCVSLITVPALSATTLINGCYQYMFYNCSSLTEIHCDATDISATNCTSNWVQGVAPKGDFYGKCETDWTVNSPHGIPNGWTYAPIDALQMTASAAQTVALTNIGGNTPNVEYSYNRKDWTSGWTYTALAFGDTNKSIYFRGINLSGFSRSTTVYSTFKFGNADAKVHLNGNIMALQNYSAQTLTVPRCGFTKAFSGATALQSVFTGLLPATSVSNSGYGATFATCTSLINAPEIKIINTIDSCTVYMFNGCKSLVDVPDFKNLKSVGGAGLWWMFSSCTSLKKAPNLPPDFKGSISNSGFKGMYSGCIALEEGPDVINAPTLEWRACESMFNGCKSLKKAPILNVKKVEGHGMQKMFSGCTSLNEVHCSATSLVDATSTEDWLLNVAEEGDFYGNADANWKIGANGLPTKWRKHLS